MLLRDKKGSIFQSNLSASKMLILLFHPNPKRMPTIRNLRKKTQCPRSNSRSRLRGRRMTDSSRRRKQRRRDQRKQEVRSRSRRGTQ